MANGDTNGGSDTLFWAGVALAGGLAAYFLWWKPKQAAAAAPAPSTNPMLQPTPSGAPLPPPGVQNAAVLQPSGAPIQTGGPQYFITAGMARRRSMVGAGYNLASTIQVSPFASAAPTASPGTPATVYPAPGQGSPLMTIPSGTYVSSSGRSTTDSSGSTWVELVDSNTGAVQGWVMSASLAPIVFAVPKAGGFGLPSGATYQGFFYSWAPYANGTLSNNPATGTWLVNKGSTPLTVSTPTGKVTVPAYNLYGFTTNSVRT